MISFFVRGFCKFYKFKKFLQFYNLWLIMINYDVNNFHYSPLTHCLLPGPYTVKSTFHSLERGNTFTQYIMESTF